MTALEATKTQDGAGEGNEEAGEAGRWIIEDGNVLDDASFVVVARLHSPASLHFL